MTRVIHRHTPPPPKPNIEQWQAAQHDVRKLLSVTALQSVMGPVFCTPPSRKWITKSLKLKRNRLIYSPCRANNFQASAGSPYVFYDKSCSNDAWSDSANPSPSVQGNSGDYSVPVSSASALVCGSAGYDKNRPEAFSSKRRSKANYDGCSALCKSKKKCKSFAFGDRTCLLYSSALGDNFEPSSESPYTFFDLACGEKPTAATIQPSSPSKSSAPTLNEIIPEYVNGTVETKGNVEVNTVDGSTVLLASALS